MLDTLPPEPPNEAIVVTARALPDPESDRAFAVITIDADRLRNAPSTQLEEVLKQVPGLQLFRRSDARSSHPTSQGATLRALGGNASSRALLVLDGVPQSDPFGGWVNWPAYDPAALGEVRVIRGGGSATFGPGALAGVIELTSKTDPAFEASLFGGSRESLEARLYAGQSIGRGMFLLSGRAARGDGFIPVTEGTRGPADRPAPYREYNFRAQVQAPISPGIELSASLSGFSDRRERGVAFTGNQTDGADASLRLVGSGRWRWSALAYVQSRELMSSFASVSADRGSASRVALQDKVPSHAYGAAVELRPPAGSGFEIRIGADTRLTDGESRELFSFAAGEPTRRRRAGGRNLTAGTFAELTYSRGPLSLSGGARIDHWRVDDGRLTERLLATGDVLRDEQYGTRSGWLPTGRAGATFDLGSGASLRAAAYLGWRMPTLNELFRPFRAGADATAANPLLDPERLKGAEIGAALRRGGLSLSATLFANQLEDAIANVTLGQGPGVFPGVGFVGANGEFRQRQNLQAIQVHGLELAAEGRRGPWSVHAGASLVDARVESEGPAAALDGLRPAQTPRLSLTAGIGWTNGERAASLLVRHTGAQYEDDRNSDRLDPATTIDGFVAWPLARTVQLVVRGENLLNERVIAGIGGDGSVERATPRTLWIGLRFKAREARQAKRRD